jgi:hypothetical protein
MIDREEWVVRKIVRDEEMHRHPNGGYVIYEGNRSVTGWGSVTQSKEDAERICEAVNNYERLTRELTASRTREAAAVELAERLRGENERYEQMFISLTPLLPLLETLRQLLDERANRKAKADKARETLAAGGGGVNGN